jgi:hypothetical protein
LLEPPTPGGSSALRLAQLPELRGRRCERAWRCQLIQIRMMAIAAQ